MLERMPQSEGRTLGFKAQGMIEEADYPGLTAATQAVVDEFGSVNLLLDLTDLKREAVSAWDDDMRFGREYRDKIDRMAIVGDSTREKIVAILAEPFVDDAEYFDEQDADAAWEWIKG